MYVSKTGFLRSSIEAQSEFEKFKTLNIISKREKHDISLKYKQSIIVK